MLMYSVYKYNWTFSQGYVRHWFLEYRSISPEKKTTVIRDCLLVSEGMGQRSGTHGVPAFLLS